MSYRERRPGVGTSLVVVIIVVLIVVAAGAAFFALNQGSTSSSSTGSSSTGSTSSGQVSSSTSPSSTSSSGVLNTLTIDAWAWPIPADLNELYDSTAGPWPNYMLYTVYQPLVSVNETLLYGNGTIRYLPGLASNWTVSPDGTTYTLNLRQNVKFSDGNPLNAYQVWLEEYGFYYLSGNSSYWWENYNIFNMTRVNFGLSTVAAINASSLVNPSSQALAIMSNSAWPIYAPNANQIVFRLAHPFIWFPGTLVAFQGLVYDAQWMLDHGGFGTLTSVNSYFNQNPIPGSGPYKVTQVAENNFVSFTQDPSYWGLTLTPAQIAAQPILDPGHVKNVIVYAKSDDLSRYTDLKTGAAQISDIQSSDWPLVTSNPQYGYVTQPPWGGQVMMLGLNAADYPTNVTLVRQAIVHAINYTALYQTAYLGLMSPFVGPEYPAWSQYYDLGGFQPYQYNVTLAQQDIASANIKNMPTFLMRIWSGCEACANAAQVIQSDLGQIGITVTIQVLTTNEVLAPMGNFATNVQNAQEIGQLDFVNAGAGWGPAALTPADYWQTFVSNESTYGNYAVYSNPTVQMCVNSFTLSDNISYIQQVCKAAQQQMYNDAPYAWVGVSGSWLPAGGSSVYDKNVIKGFLLDPLWGGQSSLPIFNTVTFVNGQDSSAASASNAAVIAPLAISTMVPAVFASAGAREPSSPRRRDS
ncbi:MAG: ABC transporter substrate-binding protein [Thaumarchaeota archaeon]|nr:ABC transporter substrate-binding protein [Nitrososphaerota archaeon]